MLAFLLCLSSTASGASGQATSPSSSKPFSPKNAQQAVLPSDPSDGAAGSVGSAVQESAEAASGRTTGNLIVRYATQEAFENAGRSAEQVGMIVLRSIPQLRAALLAPEPAADAWSSLTPQSDRQSTAGQLEALRAGRDVLFVEEEGSIPLAVVPNDPKYSSQWWPKALNLPGAWDLTTGSATVTVAILDTGLGAVPDVSGRVSSPYSIVYDTAAAWAWADVVGHGTGVTGVAAATGNNRQDMAGAAWGVKIMPVHLSDSDSISVFNVAAGLVWAADHGADVINYSASGSYSSLEAEAVNYALARGVPVVAAAGNSGGAVEYPAALPGVVAVGATTQRGSIAGFSSRGTELDFVAPGQSVLTYVCDASYYWFEEVDGTSFAAPAVTGVMALMLSRNPGLDPDRLESILALTATDLGRSGWDSTYGYGLVNAEEAVAAAGDRSSPSLAFLQPANDSLLSGVVDIRLDASDDLGVERVEVYLDGNIQMSFMESGPRSWDEASGGVLYLADCDNPLDITWDTTDLPNGSRHVVEARAYDAAGNNRAVAINVTVDNRPPTTVTSSTTTSTTLPGTQSFIDVSTSHPYYNAIEQMRSGGIISGYEVAPGVVEFRPADSLLRAQYAKMVVGAAGIDVNEAMEAPFDDLGEDNPGNLYPHEYIAAARLYGIVNGTSENEFSPWLQTSRAQVVSMVVRAVTSLHPGLLVDPPESYAGSLGSFNATHAGNMRLAEYNGLLVGLMGFGPDWDPWVDATRGEVAQILWNMMKLQ